MRIAILTNAFPPESRGGAGVIAGMYADLLRSRGHEIRVWGPGPQFVRLGQMGALRRLWFHMCDLGARNETVREIRDWRPDVLLSHNLTGCGFHTPHQIASSVRWVHMLHDVQIFEPSGRILWDGRSRDLRTVWRSSWSAVRSVSMGTPHAVVSPTAWLLDAHRAFGLFAGASASVIPNPISAGSSPQTSAADGIIYAGRLDPDKGVDLLIDAWPALRDRAKRLTLIGDGSLRTKIAAIGDPTIHLEGALSNAAVRERMRSHRVLVVPSRLLENQPTVILEGLATGCAIVAADVGGVKETLDGAGTIVPPENVDALKAGIRAALEKGSDAEAARRVLTRHDPEGCVARLEDVLTSKT